MGDAASASVVIPRRLRRRPDSTRRLPHDVRQEFGDGPDPPPGAGRRDRGGYWARERLPSAQEVALLQGLADSTSVAMAHVQMISELEQRVRDRTAELSQANAEIRRLSLTDELTGLHNLRGFNALGQAALSAARDRGQECLLAFLDVDGLKQVNDDEGTTRVTR